MSFLQRRGTRKTFLEQIKREFDGLDSGRPLDPSGGKHQR